MTKKRVVRQPVKKKPVVKPAEPEFPKELYGYFVETHSYSYHGRYGNRTRKFRHELRVVENIKKIPAGKTIYIYKKGSSGKIEKTVSVTVNPRVR